MASIDTAQFAGLIAPAIRALADGTMNDAQFATEYGARWLEWAGFESSNPIIAKRMTDLMREWEYAAGVLIRGEVATRAELPSQGDRIGDIFLIGGGDFAIWRGPSGWGPSYPFRGPAGPGAYEVWLEEPGNAGKTKAEFLSWLANAQLTVIQPYLTAAQGARDRAILAEANAELDRVATAADRVVTGQDRTAAAASTSKAAEWSDKAEDSAVETGRFSARHWSLKGAASAAAAAAARDKAADWSDKAENSTVETGRYSARHWSLKAEAFATSASGSATTSSTQAAASAASAVLSQAWAETAPDTNVPGAPAGSRSGKHWSARAEYWAGQAQAIVGGSYLTVPAAPIVDGDLLAFGGGSGTKRATSLSVKGTTGNALDRFGGGAQLMVRRANGTEAAPTAIVTGDVLGTIQFLGRGQGLRFFVTPAAGAGVFFPLQLEATGAITALNTITIKAAQPSAVFNANAAGTYAGLSMSVNGVYRWAVTKTDGAETGSNAGSDLSFLSYTDAGAFIGYALTLTRATMAAAFGGTVTAPGFHSTGATSGYRLYRRDTNVQTHTVYSNNGDFAIYSFAAGTGSADGAILQFAAGPSPVLTLAQGGLAANGGLFPTTDNTRSMGAASYRWATAYFASNPIVGSDARLKTVRAGDGLLSEAEIRWWGRNRHRVYQLNDSIAEKGEALARLHVGMIAQELRDNATAEGLDPARYALWCEDPLVAKVTKTRTVEQQAVEVVAVPSEEITVKDGRAVRRVVQKQEERGATQELLMFHSNGKPVMLAAVLDEEGAEIEPARQATYTAPLMETVEEAYEVDEPTGETRLGLRYEQCLLMETAYLRTLVDRMWQDLYSARAWAGEPFVAPPSDAAGKRKAKVAENKFDAERKIAALFGATSGFRELSEMQQSAQAAAAYLADKRHDGPLTSAEKTEQTRLKGLSAKVQTIRAVQAQRASEIVATGVASTPWPT
jgi:hypothetical protein